MSASIVIPTTMQRESLAPVVEAAVAAVAGMPDGEVVVVANGPAEGRRAFELRSPRLRVVESPHRWTPAARNLGLREARNDIVLFTDDDCLVSPEWAERLTHRLRNGDASVTTPLRMRRDGPVTTFLDYQRIFHPRPIDASTVQFAIGACMAFRRDLVRFAFDEDLEAGDDAQFGARLRDAGISTRYEAEAPPPIHLVPERVDSVTGRFFRYGISNANALLRKDRPQYSIPFATPLYSSLCGAQFATPRRFEELTDPSLRQAFAALELMLVGSLLAGYLDQAGRILGREIIRLDRDGLDAGWLEIGGKLEKELAWDGDWQRLPIDYGPWLSPRRTSAPVLAADVADNLTRHAPLTSEAGPDPDLDRGADEITRKSEEVWATVNEAWGELREGRLPAREEAIAWRLRERGVDFRDGMQTMEAIALGPVQPEAEPPPQRRTRLPAWIPRVTPRKSRTREERSTTSR